MHTLTITNWHPAKLNDLLGHWAKRHKLKSFDRGIVALSVRNAGIVKATGPRRVSLHIILGKGQRAADPDAYWKSTLDALVQCGALQSDSRQWVELGPVTFDRAEKPATVVTLEDCGVGSEQHEAA